LGSYKYIPLEAPMRPFSLNHFTYAITLLVSATALSTGVFGDEPPMPTITVTGTAEVRVVPDEAVFTFSIESREEELDETVKDNDEKIKAVTKFLSDAKVEPKHIRTDIITIRPIFEQTARPGWKGQVQLQANAPDIAIENPDKKKTKIKPIGYSARRQLSVTIKDLQSFETIYRGLIKQGVNDVGGIQFRTTELRKHRDDARLKAIKAAKEKAAAMAKELGATLAAVQTITEHNRTPFSGYAQNMIVSAEQFDGGSSSIAAGEIEVTASVQVVFKLGQTEL